MLKIFVPKDDTQRRRCYRAHLSKQLMEFLHVTTESANKQLYRILNDHPSTLDEILGEEGIPEVEWLARPDYPDEDSDQASDDLVISESASAQSRQSSASDETTGLEIVPRDGHLALRFGEAGRIHAYPRSLMYDDGDSNFESGIPDPYSPERYRKVLEHVVRRAQGVERRRTNGGTAYDMGALSETLFSLNPEDLGIVPGQRIHPGVFRRIGAAGELFVTLPCSWPCGVRTLADRVPGIREITSAWTDSIFPSQLAKQNPSSRLQPPRLPKYRTLRSSRSCGHHV